MADMGATYQLSHGLLMNIPISKITGLDPEPKMWVDDDGKNRTFEKGQTIKTPIEVKYDPDLNLYELYNGNHRLKQAKINGDTHIIAFVEFPNKSYYSSLIQ